MKKNKENKVIHDIESPSTKGGKFKFDWEGGLSDLKEQYTSVELQHKALEWRKHQILNDKK
jgi:hypothetical protein